MTPEDNKQAVPAPVPAPEAPAFVAPTSEPVTPPEAPSAAEPETPTPIAAPATLPTADDKVWISKEEYQRLQQTAAPVIAGGSGGVPTKAAALFSKLQIASTAIAAVTILLGLLANGTGWSEWMLIAGVAVLILNGIFVFTDYLASKKPGHIVKTHKGRNVVLLVISILALCSPVLIGIIGIIILIIVCSTGGCRGT